MNIYVSTIKIQIGEFRNVELDCLQFAFDNLKTKIEGCQNCQLKAEIILASANCRDCTGVYHPDFEHLLSLRNMQRWHWQINQWRGVECNRNYAGNHY